MNRIVSLILIILFGFYALGNVLVVANYYSNTASYTSNCENKDKSWINCNGQCQLKKQMDQNGNDNDAQKKGQSSETLFFLMTSSEKKSILRVAEKATFQHENQCETFSQPRSYFHPPNSSIT